MGTPIELKEPWTENADHPSRFKDTKSRVEHRDDGAPEFHTAFHQNRMLLYYYRQSMHIMLSTTDMMVTWLI
jgi:hypothetical protein